VVVNTCNGPAHILRNDGGNRHNWIELNLRGARSNRDGIGAEVTLTSASGRRQYGMATTTASYESAQDKRLYFGIGNEGSVRKLEIAWPSGTKQTILNPPVRKIITVVEK